MLRNSLLTLCVLAAAIVAIWLGLRPTSPREAGANSVDLVLKRMVNLGSGDVEMKSLDDAVARLSTSAGVRIILDWPELQAAGVSRQAHPAQLRGLTSLRYWLAAFVQQSTPAAAMKSELALPLRYSLTPDGALFVTIDHDTKQQFRIYDVRELVSDAYWGVPSAPANSRAMQADRLELLINFLKRRMNAGENAVLPSGLPVPIDRLDCFNGRLLVTTTPEKHRLLGRILASLRRMNSHDAPDKVRLP